MYVIRSCESLCQSESQSAIHFSFLKFSPVYICAPPLLEYNFVIWNPWLLQNNNLIESVQRNFTGCVCLICILPPVSYEERLPMFKLEILELRRLQKDHSNLFKIVPYFSACNIYNASNFYHATHNTRGHRFKLAPYRTNN